MFYCVILPVATVWSTALIAISSPKDSDNWFTRLMRVTDATGKDVFMSFSFQSVCRECKKLEPREMVRCTHTKNETPLHKDQHKMAKLQLAYEMENMTEEYMQEHLGIATRSTDCAYAETLLQNLTDLQRVVTDPQHVYKSIREVIMCIDPNGGGMNRCGLLIGYLNETNDDLVVCIFFSPPRPYAPAPYWLRGPLKKKLFADAPVAVGDAQVPVLCHVQREDGPHELHELPELVVLKEHRALEARGLR